MTDQNHPHRRFHPLTGAWVLASPHRTQRPWQGRQESDSLCRAEAERCICKVICFSPRHDLSVPNMSLEAVTGSEVRAFADAFRSLARAYDRLLECEFPYKAGIHQAPTTQGDHAAWQLHMHFYLPLLRSASVKNTW